MAFSPGTRLGPYDVTAQIGVGGMGEVYQATDINLKRAVAIKVLPTAVSADADRIARFQREAEVLAALNHPNIAAIYGLERSADITALVMELVEGPTLAERIAQGAIPVDEALPIARQVAEALAASHVQGIIHRDLKPANIKVRPDGIVKVLDFGIAKAMEPGRDSSPSVSQVRTVTTPAMMTQAGLILGTAAYMSPEQARGMPADKRTDLWAFGCVLYEMLSGRRAFSGETTADTIAKILESEPDWRALPAAVPRRIRELLRACLQKDQKDRIADAAHVRVRIRESPTEPSGPLRLFTFPGTVAAGALVLTLVGAVWWFAPRATPPGEHAPVSIVIADLENRTNDPTFDRVLEPVLRMMLEGSAFVSAYDRLQLGPSLAVRTPERLDERAAREIAIRQGLGVVLSSSLDRVGDGYVVSMKAAEAITGSVIASAEGRASDRESVLKAATKAVAALRSALGDEMPESAQQFAMASLSTTSLDVVRLYAAAVKAASAAKFEEAYASALKAVELDPNFGTGYLILSVQSGNLGRLEDERKYISEALRHLEGMTDRERYHTRGAAFLLNNDYQQCVKEYTAAIAKYPAEVSARNQLALCLSYLRQLRQAAQVMREVVNILPSQPIFRDNLALYSNYAGDFATAEQEARAVTAPDPYATLAQAFSQLGRGQWAEARRTYERLAEIGQRGRSFSASGLGDMAALEGRFSDAVRILRQAVADDLRLGDLNSAAAKLTAIASVELARNQPRAAVEAAEDALKQNQDVRTQFLAARTFAEAGDVVRAQPLIDQLASKPYDEPRAYAKIVEGIVALKAGDHRRAVIVLREANQLFDTWIGLFDLGRASLEAGLFAQADSAFETCLNARRGEALSLFVDERPTYSYLASAHYYLGRARESLKSERFSESYGDYLNLRGNSTEDPLVQDVRKRVGLQQ